MALILPHLLLLSPAGLQSNQQCCIGCINAAFAFPNTLSSGITADIFSLELISPKIVALGWSSLPAGPAQQEEGESEGI